MRRVWFAAALLLFAVVLSLSAAGAMGARPLGASAVAKPKAITPPPKAAAPATNGPGYLDRRLSQPAVTPSPAVAQAQADLRASLGRDGLVQVDSHTGTPRAVLKLDGFLTEPSDAAPAQIALGFVRAHLAAFGLTGSDLAALKLVKNYTDIGGTHHLVWAQMQRGIPAFDSELAAAVTADGRLVNVLGSPVPGLGVRSPSARLEPLAAVNAALRNLGARAVSPAVRSQARDATRKTVFADGNSAQLVIFGSPGHSRLGWQVRAQASPTEDYTYVVDAEDGSILWRDNSVRSLGGSVWEYNVSAINCGGGCTQRHVDFPASWSTNASRLQGEFTHTYLDLNDDNTPDAGDEIAPADYPFVDFNGSDNPSGGPGYGCSDNFPCSWRDGYATWTENDDQNAVQVYYYVSKFHDHLLAAPIGFTEAAGNFEQTNESGQGLGGDAVQAQSDDGAAIYWIGPPYHLNNANMATQADGIPPRMQMYLFYGPWGTNDTNGGDDGSIVYHEYTHGLSNRLVSVGANNTPALNTWQSIAMGEAWSDWYALDFLANQGYQSDSATEGDVRVGYFVSGGSTIRYEATDCPTGSLVAYCQPPGWVGHGGGFTYGDFARIYSPDSGSTTEPEEHSDGEIWAQMLWQLRQQLGSSISENLVTRAMELSPPNPSFLDMRNAIIQADNVNYAGANHATLWTIFANRGMGYFASTTDGMDLNPVEDFTTEAAALALPSGTLAGTISDEDSGASIAGASVEIENHNNGSENLIATSDGSGHYTMASIPEHTYPLVSVQKTGYDGPAAAPVTITGSATTTRDFTMRRDYASVLAGGTVTSFSGPDYSAYGCGPDGAFDQSLETGWSSDDGTQTIVVQLPQTVDLALSGGLQVDPSATCGDIVEASLAGYTLETSPNGSTWTVAASGTFTVGNNGHLNALTVASAAAYGVRYVRLTMQSNQGASIYMDVSEVVAYGTPVSSTCSFNGVSRTLTVPLATAGASATIRRSGNAILVNGGACGSSTVLNTDTITVTGAAGTQSLVVDLSGGVFEPGQTAEGSGTSEIEVNVDLGAGTDSVRLVGTSAADNFQAGLNGVNLNGDNDADLTLVGAESLQMESGAGNDLVSGAGGAGTGAALSIPLTSYAGDGNDQLLGGAGNDLLFGGAGDDHFFESATASGADTYTGGAGNDFVSYQARSAAVTVTTSDSLANDGAAGENDQVKSDIEAVYGGSGNDTLSGGDNADTLSGGPGNDALYGGAGADTLLGDAGSDTLYGGAGDDLIDEGSAANGADTISGGPGNDTVSYAARSNAVSVAVQDGLASDGEAGEGDLVRVDVENVLGGAGADTLVGSSADNSLSGGDGNDTIYSGDGNDTLSGGPGQDQLYAGSGDDFFDEGAAASGADVMVGGTGSDTVSYAARTNALNVSLADGLAQDGEAGEGDLVRVDVENVNGGAGADTLTGSSVANVLSGGAGNDAIFAGAGDDTLTGGAGLDALFGSDGVDTFHAQDGQADTCNGGNDSDIAADYDSGLDTLVSVP